MVGVISYATELRLFVFATLTSKSVPRLQGGVRGGPIDAFVVIVLVLMPLGILPSSLPP